ncbi:MAG: cobalamin-dependent protein [Thermomicrobiales bacterium]
MDRPTTAPDVAHASLTPALVLQVCDQLVAGDTLSLRPLVDRLLTEGVPAMAIAIGLIDPVLVEVGERWACQRIVIAQEHVATAACERALGQLALALSPVFDRGGTAVVGCPEGERHAVGARIVADWLRSDGWRVLYMGADVPNEEFVSSVVASGAALAAITVTSHQNVPSGQDLVQRLRAADAGVRILVGGGAADPGDYPQADVVVGRDLRAAVPIIAGIGLADRETSP